jgi:hypothetical protein
MKLWWPFLKQTEQANFNVTTDNLLLYEILYCLLHILATLAICKSSTRYSLLLLLDLTCDFLNFKFKKTDKTIYGNLVRLNFSHINVLVNIHY